MIIHQEPDIVDQAVRELEGLGIEVVVGEDEKRKTPAKSAGANKRRDTEAIHREENTASKPHRHP